MPGSSPSSSGSVRISRPWPPGNRRRGDLVEVALTASKVSAKRRLDRVASRSARRCSELREAPLEVGALRRRARRARSFSDSYSSFASGLTWPSGSRRRSERAQLLRELVAVVALGSARRRRRRAAARPRRARRRSARARRRARESAVARLRPRCAPLDLLGSEPAQLRAELGRTSGAWASTRARSGASNRGVARPRGQRRAGARLRAGARPSRSGGARGGRRASETGRAAAAARSAAASSAPGGRFDARRCSSSARRRRHDHVLGATRPAVGAALGRDSGGGAARRRRNSASRSRERRGALRRAAPPGPRAAPSRRGGRVRTPTRSASSSRSASATQPLELDRLCRAGCAAGARPVRTRAGGLRRARLGGGRLLRRTVRARQQAPRPPQPARAVACRAPAAPPRPSRRRTRAHRVAGPSRSPSAVTAGRSMRAAPRARRPGGRRARADPDRRGRGRSRARLRGRARRAPVLARRRARARRRPGVPRGRDGTLVARLDLERCSASRSPCSASARAAGGRPSRSASDCSSAARRSLPAPAGLHVLLLPSRRAGGGVGLVGAAAELVRRRPARSSARLLELDAQVGQQALRRLLTDRQALRGAPQREQRVAARPVSSPSASVRRPSTSSSSAVSRARPGALAAATRAHASSASSCAVPRSAAADCAAPAASPRKRPRARPTRAGRAPRAASSSPRKPDASAVAASRRSPIRSSPTRGGRALRSSPRAAPAASVSSSSACSRAAISAAMRASSARRASAAATRRSSAPRPALGQPAEVERRDRRLQAGDLLAQLLGALGSGRLQRERPQALAHLVLEVARTLDLRCHTRELQLGPVPAALEAAEAGRLLDELAPLGRLGVEHGLDPSLRDDRAQAAAEPTSESSSTRSMRRTAARLTRYSPSPPRCSRRDTDTSLNGRSGQAPSALSKSSSTSQRSIGCAAARAGEEDVVRLLGAELARAHRAGRPQDRVGDVRLPRAVRADDEATPGSRRISTGSTNDLKPRRESPSGARRRRG